MSQGEPELEAQVVATAVRLAGRGRFTMEELARAAGVSRSTLYRVVPSRAALARKLQEAGAGQLGDTRRQVLEAARRLCGRRGLLGWTIDQVAAEAGVAAATVYRTFGDRDALIAAMMEELSPRRALAELLSDGSAPLAPTLARLAAAGLRFIRDNPTLLRVLAAGDGPELRYIRRLRAQQVGTSQRLVAFLGEQVARGRLRPLAPEAMAEVLLSLVLGAALADEAAGRRGRRVDLDTRAQALVDVFLRGCGVEERRTGGV